MENRYSIFCGMVLRIIAFMALRCAEYADSMCDTMCDTIFHCTILVLLLQYM